MALVLTTCNNYRARARRHLPVHGLHFAFGSRKVRHGHRLVSTSAQGIASQGLNEGLGICGTSMAHRSMRSFAQPGAAFCGVRYTALEGSTQLIHTTSVDPACCRRCSIHVGAATRVTVFPDNTRNLQPSSYLRLRLCAHMAISTYNRRTGAPVRVENTFARPETACVRSTWQRHSCQKNSVRTQ